MGLVQTYQAETKNTDRGSSAAMANADEVSRKPELAIRELTDGPE